MLAGAPAGASSFSPSRRVKFGFEQNFFIFLLTLLTNYQGLGMIGIVGFLIGFLLSCSFPALFLELFVHKTSGT